MLPEHAQPRQFSDDAGPRKGPGPSRAMRAGHALPAVLAVLVAMVASARAAEAFGPVGRTMASEAAAVRMLSEAIVRAVRTLSEDEADEPAIAPERWAESGSPDRVVTGEGAAGERAAEAGPRLGWQSMVRPPPVE